MEKTASAAGSGGSVRSLLKGLAILRLFDSEHPTWSIEDVARRLGYPRPTAYRLMKTLETSTFLVLDPSEKRYQLGPALIGGLYLLTRPLKLEKVLHQDLLALAAETSETANLVADINGTGGILVDAVTGSAQVNLVPTLGYMDLSPSTALWRVLNAYRSEDHIRRVLPKTLTRHTSSTITDPEDLLAELARVRTAGFALEIGEFSESVCSVSAPVRNMRGDVIAAVSLILPPERFQPERREHIVEQVVRAAAMMSCRLGYGHAAEMSGGVSPDPSAARPFDSDLL